VQKHENQKNEKHAGKRRHIQLAAKDLFVARKSHFEMTSDKLQMTNNDTESFVRTTRTPFVICNSSFIIVSP
jgi:hypothetical protein